MRREYDARVRRQRLARRLRRHGKPTGSVVHLAQRRVGQPVRRRLVARDEPPVGVVLTGDIAISTLPPLLIYQLAPFAECKYRYVITFLPM